jgi:trans-aconitate methyltransferase
VTEPELMDEDEQAEAYARADFTAPHELFVERFAASWPPSRGPVHGPILDLGCGPADVTVRLAKRYPHVTIHGIDGSAAMLRHGAARIQREGLTSRVLLAHTLLPRDSPPLAEYAVVVSNSLLHHLHDPQVLWTAVARFAAPNAHVFLMDLMRPATRVDVDRLVHQYARDEPEILRRDFGASLSAAFTIEEVRAQLDAAGLGALRIDVVSDRHLTVSGELSR